MYTFVDNLHSVLNKNNMIPVNVTNHEISYKILMNIWYILNILWATASPAGFPRKRSCEWSLIQEIQALRIIFKKIGNYKPST